MILRVARKVRQSLCEDISAEVVCQIYTKWQEQPGLGYSKSKGNPDSYYYVLIWRYCVKSLRKFKDSFCSLDNWAVGSYTDNHVQFELNELIEMLDEKEQAIINHCLKGRSVKDFSTEKSTRTTYRLLERSVEKLQKALI